MNSARALVDLMVFFCETVKRIYTAVGLLGVEYDARSLEAYIEEQVKTLGALILERAMKDRGAEMPKPDTYPCKCGGKLHRKGKRPCTLRGILGALEIEERYYYICPDCEAKEFLGDELRGETHFTQLAEERMVLAGKEHAFEQAAESLARQGVLHVAASTIRDVCVRLGRRARQILDREGIEQYGASAPKPEEHADRLAIGVDGTMIGRIDPQHRHRRSRKTDRKVRGKGHLKHFFHEVKTLVAFNFNERGEAIRKTFHATQARADEFRQKASLEAARRGADFAKVLVILGDGAAWIWKTAADNFPKAIQVLDWYHATEHLWAAARARFGNQEKAVWAWVKAQENNLWHGKREAVIEALRALAQEVGTPDQSLSDDARQRDSRWIVHRNVKYFEENYERMDYPRFREMGLPIGSGVVESSCRHVVADRCRGPGMRWDEEGCEDILALRCLDLNGRWDYLWPVKRAA